MSKPDIHLVVILCEDLERILSWAHSSFKCSIAKAHLLGFLFQSLMTLSVVPDGEDSNYIGFSLSVPPAKSALLSQCWDRIFILFRGFQCTSCQFLRHVSTNSFCCAQSPIKGCKLSGLEEPQGSFLICRSNFGLQMSKWAFLYQLIWKLPPYLFNNQSVEPWQVSIFVKSHTLVAILLIIHLLLVMSFDVKFFVIF